MKPELEALCMNFIASRDAVHKAFRLDDSSLFSACANIFCACGKTADTDRLKECRKILKKHTKPFSRFRGRKVRSFLSAVLSLADDPENRMTLANEYYHMLKRQFKGTEYLILAAFLLTDLAGINLTQGEAARGKELFRRMNQKHRILTNNTDSVFAMLLVYSEKTDDKLIEDMEACYIALKTVFSSSGDVQTMAQVLSSSAGSADEKAQRVSELYNALLEADVRYGRSGELAPLAALSLTDTPVPVLAGEIREVYTFLENQKGYGSKEEDLNRRAMHAVMIVSDQYAVTAFVNITVMTNTLDMLISKAQAARISFFVHVLESLASYLVKSDKRSEQKSSDSSGGSDAEKQPE